LHSQQHYPSVRQCLPEADGGISRLRESENRLKYRLNYGLDYGT